MLSSILGPHLSALIFHMLGSMFIIIISIVKRNKLNLKKIKLIFYLAGMLSVITIMLNNISISKIGLTLSLGMTLFGQIVMSNLIDQFGLFDTPINRFKKEKIWGYMIVLVGIIIMSTM